MDNLLSFKDLLSDEGILISFNGSFINSIIEEIGRAVRTYLKEKQLERGIISDVFAVYIEQTQNIRNYLELNGILTGDHSSAVVTIGQKDGDYTICSGNSIKKSDVASLTDYLDELNALDKIGLKKLYKTQLRKPASPESRSAGLGLIDIFRKASEKVQYCFQNQDEEYDFFSLIVTVKGDVGE